ncbi:Uncharacterised protein [Chlamydia trachomatis]|nr:Uncharacterised protein [Chlamydia trachomatis]
MHLIESLVLIFEMKDYLSFFPMILNHGLFSVCYPIPLQILVCDDSNLVVKFHVLEKYSIEIVYIQCWSWPIHFEI